MFFHKKCGGGGVSFGDGRKKANRIRQTLVGKPHVSDLHLYPGIFLCGVSAAREGHMFVIVVTECAVTVS